MRCVSRARAFCRAPPTARRSAESAGARTCSSRSQPRARAKQRARAIKPQRFVLEKPRQPFAGGGVERAQTQVLADAPLMCGDRLLPEGVGVDRLGVGAQLQGREPQDLPVDLERRLSRESAEHPDEGDLVRETQPVVGTPPQGDLAAIGLEEGGIGYRHGSVSNKRPFLAEQFSGMEHDAFRVPHLSDTIPEPAFHGQAVKTVAYLRVSTPQQDESSQRLAILRVRADARTSASTTSSRRPPPVAGSDRDDPRRPRQGRGRVRGAEGEHPGRGQARHPDEGDDHVVRAVRRGRARPDLGAHPRGPRPGQGLGPEARSPEGLAGRLTARRPKRTRSGASSSWGSRRPPSPSSRGCPGPPCTAS